MPRSMKRNEFMFLSSVLVPSSVSPRGRTEMLASQRSEPSSMLQSLTPSVSIVFLSSVRNRFACSGVRMSGSVTISTSGVPTRLKSTNECELSAMRPVEPACTSLAASSSMCARVIPTRNVPPSPSGTSR